MTALLLALALAQTTDPHVRNDPGGRMVVIEEDATSHRPTHRGLDGAVALGVGFAGGEAVKHARLGGLAEAGADAELQMGYKTSARLLLGGYAGARFGGAGLDSQCTSRCDAVGGRGGVLVRLELDPLAATNPWVAVGTGYEVLAIRDGGRTLASLRGREDLRVEVGLDLRQAGGGWLGLFAAASTGVYERFGGAEAEAIAYAPTARHLWVTVGSRFRLGPP